MKLPVRYDGHVCDHEILHRKTMGNLNYTEDLFTTLSETDTIITDVNLYTIPNICSHFQNLIEDFPNIKNVILTANPYTFDSITYTDRFEKFCPEVIVEPTSEYHNFIVEFNWNSLYKKNRMPACHFYKNIKFLRSLYWSDELEVYSSDHFLVRDSSYSHWFKSIQQYYPITTEFWDKLIEESLKRENFILSDNSHISKFNIIKL